MNLKTARDNADISSWDALAECMLRLQPDLVGKRVPIKNRARTLGLYLGDLHKGKRISWWENHLVAHAVLRKVLNVSERIVASWMKPRGEETAPPEEGFFTRLDPSHANEWLIDQLGWTEFIGARRRQERGSFSRSSDEERPVSTVHLFNTTDAHRHWVVAPSGAGKTLAAQVRESRLSLHSSPPLAFGATFSFPKQAIRQLRTLSELELEDIDPEAHLFVEVAQPDPTRDESVLEALRQRGRILIAAPFRRTGAPPPKQEVEQDQADLDPTRWLDWAWAPPKDWRSLWLGHLETRIRPGTSFDLDRAGRLIDLVDPSGELLRTPGDLEAFCELLAKHPADAQKADKQERADLLLDAWLRTQTSNEELLRSLRSLVETSFVGVYRGWPPSADLAAWKDALPFSGPDAIQRSNFEAQLKDIVASPKKQQEDKAARLLAALDPAPAERLESLQRAQLLTVAENGEWTLGPPWVVRGLAARHARMLVTETGETRRWGRLSVDPHRRPLIVEAVSELTPTQLMSVVRAVLRAQDPKALGWVAAVELLFEELGRRFIADWRPTPGDIPILQQLAQEQLQALVPRYDRSVLSRRTVAEPNDTSLRSWWHACCWAWSFVVPSPETEPIPKQAEWLFPGWCQPTTEEPTTENPTAENPTASQVLKVYVEGSGVGDGWVHGGVLLELLAPHVLLRLAPGSKAMGVLAPTAWLKAVEERRLDEIDSIDIHAQWHLDLLSKRAKERGLAGPVARELYRLITTPPGSQGRRRAVLLDDNDSLRGIRGWIFEHISPEDFQTQLQTFELRPSWELSLSRAVGILRPELRPIFLEAMIKADPAGQQAQRFDIEKLGRSELGLLERLLEHFRATENHIVWTLVTRITELDPDRVLELALDAFQRDPEHPTTRALFWRAGTRFPGRMNTLLRESGVPSWGQGWLVQRLHEGGADADEAFELLRGIEVDGKKQRRSP